MKGEFMWDMGGALDTMRLIAEGAVVLFEEDTSPITKLARDNGELVAGTAFNTIGGTIQLANADPQVAGSARERSCAAAF